VSPNGGERDGEIARLFEEKRRSDESSAPPVRELLARPKGSRAGRARTAWGVALAAAAAVVVAVSVVLLRARPPRTPETRLPAVAAQIAAWRAPTDALLQTPGSDLLSQLPVLESHISEAAGAVLEPTKGVER
jgi:hypothetical protein